MRMTPDMQSVAPVFFYRYLSYTKMGLKRLRKPLLDRANDSKRELIDQTEGQSVKRVL